MARRVTIRALRIRKRRGEVEVLAGPKLLGITVGRRTKKGRALRQAAGGGGPTVPSEVDAPPSAEPSR